MTSREVAANSTRQPERPVAQAAASWSTVINVYSDRVEVVKGLNGQHRETITYKALVEVRLKGWVNCTLTLEDNTGRVLDFEKLSLGEAREVKDAIETGKQRAAIQS